MRPSLTQAFRAEEWWEYKLAPILAAMYATALTIDVAQTAVWPALLIALAALVPGAATQPDQHATDRATTRSGKPMSDGALEDLRVCHRGTAAPESCCIRGGRIAAGALFARGGPSPVFPHHLAGRRAALGVLADASGANLFPTLALWSSCYRRPNPVEFVDVASSVGVHERLRGILWLNGRISSTIAGPPSVPSSATDAGTIAAGAFGISRRDADWRAALAMGSLIRSSSLESTCCVARADAGSARGHRAPKPRF